MCTTQAARNVRYQGPLLPYYSKGNSPAVWLLGRHGSCRQAVYVNVHTYMHRYGCCTCMYMVVISLIFLFFNFWRCLKREFWIFSESRSVRRNTRQALGLPRSIHILNGHTAIPKFRLSYSTSAAGMLCDQAIFVWHLRIVCRLFVS